MIMYKFLITAFLIWRISLFATAKIGEWFIPQRTGFLGPSPWANFDGVHYLSIAQNGYLRYQEAFFPLYPLLVRFLAKTVFFDNYLLAGLFISHLSFFAALVIFYKLVRLEFNEKVAKVGVVGFLVFPTSFFFGSLYTESLFLLLILASFYAAKKEKWLWVGIFGGLASATRLVGIFLLPALLWQWWQSKLKMKIETLRLRSGQDLKMTIQQFSNPLWLFLIPVGLISYTAYLKNFVGDSLAFIHAQPAFGAQRTGGEIILLPQVYWRYLKILFNVSFSNYDLWIALLEFFLFNFALLSLWWVWRKRINASYLIFSLLALLGPTLTGTLSSLPRYMLVLFPIFILYGLIENRGFRATMLIFSFLLLAVLTILFTRGFFVA